MHWDDLDRFLVSHQPVDYDGLFPPLIRVQHSGVILAMKEELFREHVRVARKEWERVEDALRTVQALEDW